MENITKKLKQLEDMIKDSCRRRSRSRRRRSPSESRRRRRRRRRVIESSSDACSREPSSTSREHSVGERARAREEHQRDSRQTTTVAEVHAAPATADAHVTLLSEIIDTGAPPAAAAASQPNSAPDVPDLPDAQNAPDAPETAAVQLPDDTEANDSPTDEALDSIVLEILGEDPTATTEYGKEIHKELANRFEHIVTTGLTKEVRKELFEKYLTPSNCVSTRAPILNAEIKAALPETLQKRDKSIEARQKQIAAAISCVAEVITVQLTSKEKNHDLLKKLMDAGRLLCDIQHAESSTRRNFAVFSLKKDMKEHLQHTKIDKYLFGENLSESLKTAKAVCKSGTDLKLQNKSAKKPRAPMASATKAQSSKALNWKTPAPARRQPGPQRSREPGSRRSPPATSSRPSSYPPQPARRR